MTTFIANPLLKRQFEIVREDLHRRYDHLFPTSSGATIDEILDTVITELLAEARVETFLPVLAEREAAERIEKYAELSGTEAFSRREILFADEHNSGRSQIASALARELVGDDIFVRSIGLSPVGGIDNQVIRALNNRGIETEHLYQKSITPRLSHRADIVVLMGIEEVPGVPGHRYVSWDIEDTAGKSLEEIDTIIDDIETHIRALLVDMGFAISK